jgi:hypothetical protein
MPTKIRTFAVTALLALFPGFAAGLSAQAPPDVGSRDTGRAATITATDISRRVGIMAHDSMAGRATPSPGLT